MDWLLTLCVIAASVLAAKAFFRTRALTATILALKASVEVLDHRLSRLDDPAMNVPVMPPAEAALPEETFGEAIPFPAQIAEPLPPAPAGKGWEEILVENWLVWLGGVALALGGAFLVKLSIDYGLLAPACASSSACCSGSPCGPARSCRSPIETSPASPIEMSRSSVRVRLVGVAWHDGDHDEPQRADPPAGADRCR